MIKKGSLIWVCMVLALAAKSSYFAQYTRPLYGNWQLHQWIKQPLYIVNNQDSIAIDFYFVFANNWYAQAHNNRSLYKLNIGSLQAINKAEASALIKHINWRRWHKRYHGFVRWLTLLLVLPTLLLVLLPAAMFLVNALLKNTTGTVLFVPFFKWWIAIALAALWYVEFWLCTHPQSF